jgi:hypothetical protein
MTADREMPMFDPSVLDQFVERHPFSGAVYRPLGPERVRVTLGDRCGDFTRSGVWLAGDLKSVDPQLCRWVCGGLIFGRPQFGPACEDEGT